MTDTTEIAPRPRGSDPEVRAAAIRSIATACAQWGGSDGTDAGTWERMLAKCSLALNGYEIAKDLESAGAGPDAELVEILDSARSELWCATDAAVAVWVKAHDIKPSLAVGTRVTYARPYRIQAGVITKIDEESGRYVFVPDDDADRFANGGGYLVAYEDVEQGEVPS